MATALDRIAPADYQLQAEKDKPEATTFVLRPLTPIEMMEVSELMMRAHWQGVRRTMELGLIGWRDFKSKSGVDVEFTSSQTVNLSYLTIEKMSELSNEISKRSKVSEEDLKN